MQVVEFTPEHADELAQLISRTLRLCHTQDYGAERIEAMVARHTATALLELSRRRCILLALDGSRIIGTASLERNWIYAVFVDPDLQRHGVGTRLMQELEKRARESAFSRLGVYSSVSAVQFYERVGFAIEETTDTAEHGRAVEMSKSLA
jgi:GNAT superfamily N-acetyltransferase